MSHCSLWWSQWSSVKLGGFPGYPSFLSNVGSCSHTLEVETMMLVMVFATKGLSRFLPLLNQSIKVGTKILWNEIPFIALPFHVKINCVKDVYVENNISGGDLNNWLTSSSFQRWVRTASYGTLAHEEASLRSGVLFLLCEVKGPVREFTDLGRVSLQKWFAVVRTRFC